MITTMHNTSEGGDNDDTKTNNSAVAITTDTEEQSSSSHSSSLSIIAALKNLSLNSAVATTNDAAGGESLLSEGATIASLALLALTLAQGRDCAIQLISPAVVDLVNSILCLRDEGEEGRETATKMYGTGGFRLPANGTNFATSVNALLSSHQGLMAVEDKPYLDRLILLTRVSLMLAQGTWLLASFCNSCIANSLTYKLLSHALFASSFA